MTQTTSHPPQQPAGEPNVTEADRALVLTWMNEGEGPQALRDRIARYRESACREAVEAATAPLYSALLRTTGSLGLILGGARGDGRGYKEIYEAGKSALANHEALHRREEGKL